MSATVRGRKRPIRKASPRLRTILSEADKARLEAASRAFGMPEAEVVRRLIRAAVQAGPALNAEEVAGFAGLNDQIRRLGRNVSQILHAIHSGHAARIGDTETVWRELFAALRSLNEELTEMTVSYGSRLRRQAGLSGQGPQA